MKILIVFILAGVHSMRAMDAPTRKNGMSPHDTISPEGRLSNLLQSMQEKNVAAIDARLLVGALIGNLREVEEALAEEAHPDANINGVTAIYLAADEGHADVVEFLIAYPVRFEAHDLGQHTPLNAALSRGHYEIIRLLLRNGVDFDPTPETLARINRSFDQTLVAAAIVDGLPLAQVISSLSSAVSPVTVAEALLYAAVQGRGEVVALLISHLLNTEDTGTLENALQWLQTLLRRKIIQRHTHPDELVLHSLFAPRRHAEYREISTLLINAKLYQKNGTSEITAEKFEQILPISLRCHLSLIGFLPLIKVHIGRKP